MKLSNIVLFTVVSLMLISSACKQRNRNNQKKPNIIIILADDLGYADVGFHGSEEVITPHIDAIAKSGVVFSYGYVTAAVCSPSRVGLLTGKYQQRLGCDNNPAPYKLKPEVMVGLPLEQKTVADRLKNEGYATACFGKWHLGGERGDETLYPENRGFDEYFGFLEGAALYIDPLNSEKKYMRSNETIQEESHYYTDALGRESLSFIERNIKNPFFLYLSFSAVHAPLEATDRYLKLFADIKDDKRKKMLAMLYAMDENIGRITDLLKKRGLFNNTLIIFLSDNGGKPKGNASINTPLRGEKGQYFEGGIHIPFTMSWNGHIPAGQTYEKPVSAIDIFPTVLEAAGISIQDEWKVDGVDLLPYINDLNSNSPHERLYWKANGNWAVRDLKWKLLKQGRDTMLFEIMSDPYEKNNMIKKNPEVVEQLLITYKEWNRSNIPARYGYNKRIFKYKVDRTRRIGFAP